MRNARLLWSLSIGTAILFAAGTGMLWYRIDHTYVVEPDHLVDDEFVIAYLQDHQAKSGASEPIYIRTGMFIQSLAFTGAKNVNLTGYVWQIYEDGVHDDLSRGVVFPEAVESADTAVMQEAYRRRIRLSGPQGETDAEVVGWYFESILRQQFDYRKYPLDHKIVWVRMWHEDFDRNIVLVPDLGSYDSTLKGDAFGVENEIVLGGWDIEESYFLYRHSSYDTNFGITDYVGQADFPELYFNIVIRRDFLNAFIVNLVPLLVVASLLFAIVMTITGREERIALFGFNMSGVIGATSALFFVVMLAHIQLREQFETGGIVYLEYYFLLMYVALMTVAINTYVFTTGSRIFGGLIQYKDNLLPKILYWPSIFGAALVLSLIVLLRAQ